MVGSHGHGGLLGPLPGSVGQHCTQHAPCPVVVSAGRSRAGGAARMGATVPQWDREPPCMTVCDMPSLFACGLSPPPAQVSRRRGEAASEQKMRKTALLRVLRLATREPALGCRDGQGAASVAEATGAARCGGCDAEPLWGRLIAKAPSSGTRRRGRSRRSTRTPARWAASSARRATTNTARTTSTSPWPRR
ncbi:universal stress protein [Streptomyces sp. YGL11-2]|uniref:universal stress protein n=1 Tax=Streptomyces sp. YGL11-2 TaxID=3414028 RepID=UPI003CF86815